MQYILTFIEGIISFISPCMLPLLPLYVSYFAPDRKENAKPLLRSLFFVLGFTVVFTSMGVFAGFLGSFFMTYRTVLNVVCGFAVIVFGLSYLEVIRLPFMTGRSKNVSVTGLASSFLFGMIYSVSLTPCVGAFLGSALMTAANSARVYEGALLLLCYSMGLGIPFVFSALLLDSLKGVFGFIKNNYKIINTVCGVFLIIVGIMMMTGYLGKLLSFFA